ncbi:MAG: HDOD domain-containing protein, partial [Desulfobulbaceae bacterium]|nr:HDOD domain-containing protein [Desulfobulbaceae bacterium]
MSIKKILEKTGDMPTLPSVAARINSEMLKESLTARRLGAIISEDAALTAKILRLANSAFYGLSSQVVSVEKAIIILGFNAVKNLALSISIYSFFRKGIKTNIDVQGLWNHCLGCAVAAKILVEKTDKRLGDDAFLFG